jgi:hypothetical protein
MSTELKTVRPNVAQRVLPVLATVFFWLLPVSPFLAIVALSKTRSSTGWPRKLARTAAYLCIGYTALLSVWVTVCACYWYWPLV